MNKLFHLVQTKQKTILVVFFCFFCYLFSISFSFAQDTEIDSVATIKVDSTSKIVVKETLQPKDSTKTKQKIDEKLQVELEPKFKLRPPTRAALLSAVLPGAGQYYNRKAWAIKVPLVAVALAVPAYFSIQNHAEYRIYRENYLYMQDENPATKAYPSFESRNPDQVKRQRDSYRRDRDFYMIVTGLIYLLNIGEATTTAHFNNFDIDDDISFKFKTQMENVGMNNDKLAGISLVMTF